MFKESSRHYQRIISKLIPTRANSLIIRGLMSTKRINPSRLLLDFKNNSNLIIAMMFTHLSKKPVYLFLFTSFGIALYRLLFMWRRPISNFYADEKNWQQVAQTQGFIRSMFTPDAGYLVPLTRAVFSLNLEVSSSPALTLHLLSCIVAGACCSSIVLFHNLDIHLEIKLLIALCLGFYQSFDLLLWMNVNYYLFIPGTLFLLSYILNGRRNQRALSSFGAFLLIVSVGKPQLILALILLLAYSFLEKNFKFKKILEKKFEWLVILTLLNLLAYSALSQNSLFSSAVFGGLIFALFSVFKVIFVLIAPFLAILNAKIASVLDVFLYSLISNLAIVIFVITMAYQFFLTSKFQNIKIFQLLLATMAPVYISLFIYPNTGWSNAMFWSNDCISCMSSRHFFPLFFLSVMIFQLFLKTKFLSLLLLQILSLNFVYYITRQFF